jgi:hypothetical protein
LDMDGVRHLGMTRGPSPLKGPVLGLEVKSDSLANHGDQKPSKCGAGLVGSEQVCGPWCHN